LLEVREVDRDGTVTSQTVIQRAVDPALRFDQIPPNSIYEAPVQKVCVPQARVIGTSSQILEKPLDQIRWVDIARGRSFVLRIDPDSVRRAPSGWELIGLEEYAEAKTSPQGGAYRFAVVRTIYDCGTQRQKVYEAEYYSSEFELVGRERYDRDAVPWPAVAPDGSVGAIAVRYICSRQEREGAGVAAQKTDPVERGDSQPQTGGSGLSVSSGTGWVTDTGYVVTAYHVVENRQRIVVLDQKKQVYRATIERQDRANDIVVLSVDFRGTPPRGLPTSKSATGLGVRIFTIGYPHVALMGLQPKLTAGEISALSGAADDPRFFQISAPVQAGNSGGPLINLRGEVVGLISAKLQADKVLKATGDLTQNVNYAVKVRYVEGALADVREARGAARITPTTMELAVDQVAARVQDAVVLVLADDGDR
jgi:S1-C subfamily serine protease